MQSGSRSLTFDGRGDDGRLLPDGVYTAKVVSNETYGISTQESKQVRMDDTPPEIAVIAPATPKDPIQVSATDVSGVSSLSAGTPTSFYDESGSYLSSVAVTKTTTVDAPSHKGWTPCSTVQVVVSAEDSLGNTASRVTRAVLIPGGPRSISQDARGALNALSSTPSRQKHSTVARHGLRVSGPGTGRVRITIRVFRAVARRLRSRSTRLVTKTVGTSGGRFTVRLKFSPKVRSALRGRARTTMRVSVSGGATGSKTVAIVR